MRHLMDAWERQMISLFVNKAKSVKQFLKSRKVSIPEFSYDYFCELIPTQKRREILDEILSMAWSYQADKSVELLFRHKINYQNLVKKTKQKQNTFHLTGIPNSPITLKRVNKFVYRSGYFDSVYIKNKKGDILQQCELYRNHIKKEVFLFSPKHIFYNILYLIEY